MKGKRLGDILVSQKIITNDQLMEALRLQKEQGKRLGQTLIDNGFITENQLIDTLRYQLGIDFIDLSKIDIPVEMSEWIPKSVAVSNGIVPVSVSKDTLFIAMEDPLNFYAIEEAKQVSKKKIVPMIASRTAIEHAINALYGNEKAAKAIAQMRSEAGISEESIRSNPEPQESEQDGPTIRLINSIIERAYEENASDIHFEPTKGDMVVRIRVDGILHKILTIPSELKDSATSRLKVMSHINITEKRIPQDGRAVMMLNGKEVDMRFSTLPTIYGEKTVIRLLTGDASMLNRAGIGLPETESGKIDKLLATTSGVILIVGPTGSGKSSTMYTLAQELIGESTNLITLEDPVEIKFDGATQVQINEKVGMTFASALRSVLRQDPDIICVGEIRDGETAEIAMRAALTGHLVISTLHTEDAVSAITRLIDMGVPPYLVAAGVRGIISQRLMRRICNRCRTEDTPDETTLKLSELPARAGRKYYRGKGCDYCFNSGYRGRIGVFEVLMMDDELRQCITHGVNQQEFRRIARKGNFTSMLDHADDLVEQGITSVSEVVRTLLTDN